MKREFSAALLVISLLSALPPRADAASPEEASQAAYEQVQGKAVGGGAIAAAHVQASAGLKTPPPTTHTAMTARPMREIPPVARRAPLPDDKRPATPLDRLAGQGVNGVMLCALLGLGIGAGFGYLTGREG